MRNVGSRDRLGEVVVTGLGEVAPAVLVVIGGGVPCIAARIGLTPSVFLDIVHEVVVGEDLAGVELADLEEVVEIELACARRIGRAELDADSVGVRKFKDLAQEILSPVGEAVPVIVVDVRRVNDAVRFLPPIGHVVAVGVDSGPIVGVKALVRLPAKSDIVLVGIARRHFDTVADNDRIPVEFFRFGIDIRRIIVSAVLLPGIGKAVGVVVKTGKFPSVGGSAVPHLLAGLCISIAERNEIGRRDKRTPESEFIIELNPLERIAELLHDLLGAEEALVKIKVEVVRRIRLGGIVERILLQTMHLCRRISRTEEFRIEERVKGRTVDGGQVHDCVLDPRNYAVIVIYLTLEV